MKAFSLRTVPLVIGLISLLLTGCGGGGGGGGGGNTPPSTNPPATNPPPSASITANAGADRTVNAGDVVELKAGGTGNITGYSWSRTNGPSVTLTAVDLNAGWFTFIAPSTGAQASTTLTYRLTVSGPGGASAEDTVVFTILRVNQAPAVSAGSDQRAKGKTTVTLNGSATDSDGSIATYLWEQIEGDPVVIESASSVSASFVAPSTFEDITLRFRLTVTDNDDASSQSEVTILVTPEDAPELAMHFPPASGIYTGNSIVAYGIASAVATDLISVTLDAGAGPVTATLDNDGNWRATAVPIPAGVTNFELVAEATDGLGRKTRTHSVLNTSGTSHGAGGTWAETRALTLDAANDRVHVLTSGTLISDIKILPIDLKTGNRGNSVSDFSNASLGTNYTAFTNMTYDPTFRNFYLTSAPADESLDPRIVQVNNFALGSRRQIGTNTNPATRLINPVAVTKGNLTDFYVADVGSSNVTGAIYSFSSSSGQRTVVANSLTQPIAINRPLSLAYYNPTGMNYLFVGINNQSNQGLILALDLKDSPATTYVVTNSSSANSGPTFHRADHMALDIPGGQLYFLDTEGDRVMAVEVATGVRRLVAANAVGSTTRGNGMAFDQKRQVLYVAGGNGIGADRLRAIDPISGRAVLLSR